MINRKSGNERHFINISHCLKHFQRKIPGEAGQEPTQLRLKPNKALTLLLDWIAVEPPVMDVVKHRREKKYNRLQGNHKLLTNITE